jgi:hypothetical protein
MAASGPWESGSRSGTHLSGRLMGLGRPGFRLLSMGSATRRGTSPQAIDQSELPGAVRAPYPGFVAPCLTTAGTAVPVRGVKRSTAIYSLIPTPCRMSRTAAINRERPTAAIIDTLIQNGTSDTPRSPYRKPFTT